ncbi:MAG: serine hydrolase [Filifactoraceae bacterium]
MKINKKNKLFIITIIISLMLSLFQSNIYAIQGYPYIVGKVGLVIEFNTGSVLYEKGMNEKIYPASTTKLLTALIVKEKLDTAMSVTAPDNFPVVEGTSINIVPGETFTVEQLLNAMLVRSGNDVATLLAITISGSTEEFTKLMNEKAKSLGCTNSNFVNPSGLHDENHYTTASDMSKIAMAFFNDKTLKEIVSKKEYVVTATNKKPQRTLTNTNKFLTGETQIENNGSPIPVQYNIVDGIKTGTTPEAGNCLISTGQKENMRIISLVFGSNEESIYSDSRYLLDYGFDNFKRVELVPENFVAKTLKKPLSAPATVDLVVSEAYSYVEPVSESSKITGEATFNKLKTPLKAGEKVGVYRIKNENTNTIIKELDICAATDYESKISWNYMGKSTFGKIFRIIILIAFILIAISSIFMGIRHHNIKRRRENLRKKRELERQKNINKNKY